jgi:hypothetical protein
MRVDQVVLAWGGASLEVHSVSDTSVCMTLFYYTNNSLQHLQVQTGQSLLAGKTKNGCFFFAKQLTCTKIKTGT